MSSLRSDTASDWIDFGSPALLDGLDPVTLLFWIYPRTLNANYTIWNKAVNFGVPFLSTDAADQTELRVRWPFTTANSEAVTTGAGLTVNKWWCIAHTFDSSRGTHHAIFCGDFATPLAECSYSLNTNGVGSYSSDAANNWALGARIWSAVRDRALDVHHGFHAAYNRILTLAELREQQYRPRRRTGCVLHTFPGYRGTTKVADWSGGGNPGTVNGFTTAAGLPIAPPFGPLSLPGIEISIPTKTGVGAVTTGAATTSGSATFVPPTYAGTGAVTTTPTQTAGVATFEPPTFTATGAVTIGSSSVAGTATFAPPVYSGTGTATTSTTIAAGTGTFVPPTYSADGAVTTTATVAAGVALFASAIFTATGAVTTTVVSVAGTGTFVPPTYTADGAVTVSGTTAAGTATFAGLAFSGDGAATVGAATAAGTATFVPPIYSATGTVTTTAATAQGSGIVTLPPSSIVVLPLTIVERGTIRVTERGGIAVDERGKIRVAEIEN